MTDTPQPCTECGEDPQANLNLQEEIERLHVLVSQYEISITTHRKLMLTQIDKLAQLQS